MKKIILQNSEDSYEIRYVISKNRYADYYHNKKTCLKVLEFLKNGIYHRPCNLGPQYRNKNFNSYYENNQLHNLYGYAWIDNVEYIYQYWIYNIEYTESQFFNYLSIYNNLSYKRIY